MANKQGLILFIFVISLYFCDVVTSSSKVKQLYCWSGNNLDKLTSSNQSCSTGDKTQPNSVSLIEESSDDTGNHGNITDPANMTTITTDQSQINAAKCYYFIYHDKKPDFYLRYPDQDKGEAIQISHETTVNGVNGTLECCDTNNCNFAKSENQLPNNHLSCFNVTHDGEGVPNATIQHCKSRDDVCMKVKVIGHDDYKEKYFCGETPLCDSEVEGVKTARCTNETHENKTVETCCCKGDRCLVPEFNYTLVIRSQSNDRNESKQTPCCASKKIDWVFVGGLIAAGVLVISIVVGVLVVISRCKKRQADNNRLTLAYSRIAADATGEEEDIQMLLP
ncbi:hypothetical protein KUTeg_004699 [Tegillarca granosa]|uniref:Uncharacterized protein n=1 Tax=Tegillarca granosa TaxID=220873 RepID=A0ABQ9FKL5_TEGGR|nr:hypothetical protein KUTeg_004699 [Tegillarca granosa]